MKSHKLAKLHKLAKPTRAAPAKFRKGQVVVASPRGIRPKQYWLLKIEAHYTLNAYRHGKPMKREFNRYFASGMHFNESELRALKASEIGPR